MKLFSWLSRASSKADKAARQQLFDCMMENVPNGMNPSQSVRNSVWNSLKELDASTAEKVQGMILTHRAKHHNIALLPWDALERLNPKESLNRIVDNFDYMAALGWGYPAAMPGLVLRAFPNEPWAKNLTTEQQHALLRLEDSRWQKNFTSEGGTKTKIRPTDPACVEEVVVARPRDIERIIDLAATRQPESIEHYLALLDIATPEPMKEGLL